MSVHHHVLTIPGGANLPPDFHRNIINRMAEQWQSRTAQGFKTFADGVDDTVPDWIKRRYTKTNASDEADASTLRDLLCAREATAKDFNAFLSTSAPHALTKENLFRLRTIFLINASGSTVQSDQKTQVNGEALREASLVIRAALEALHIAKKLVVVQALENVNLEVHDPAAGSRVDRGERLSGGASGRLRKMLAEHRVVVAEGKGSAAAKMIEMRPNILKAAKAELQDEPFFQVALRLAGVEALDDETIEHFLTDYRKKGQADHGTDIVAKNNEAARMTALAKHVSTLDAETLEDVFGPTAKRIKKAIENDLLAQILIGMGETKFNGLFSMHGGVEGVLKIEESPFVSKIAKESHHPVGHNENPEHIVLDLARFGMAGSKTGDSVTEGGFMSTL